MWSTWAVGVECSSARFALGTPVLGLVESIYRVNRSRIAGSAGELRSLVEEIANRLGTIAGQTDTLLASAEELAASGEEQSASTEEIASSANQLAEAADRLTGAVKSFRLLADEVQQAAD